MLFDSKTLHSFPSLSGVYLMKDQEGHVLYVGKAKNLKNRLKQYFTLRGDGRPQVPYLLAQVATIETIVVDSEKEALLLENTLIKKYQPKYNSLFKDDKGYIALHINTESDWPVLELVRYKGVKPSKGRLFGPYVSAAQARELFDLVVKHCLLRQCSDEEFARRTRPCILYSMRRCSAPCVELVSKEEYHRQIERAIHILEGHANGLIAELEEEMRQASQALAFEKAKELLEKIALLKSLSEKQSVELSVAVDSDVWNMCREGAECVVNKLMYRNRRLIGSTNFTVTALQDDAELLQLCIVRYYLASMEVPKEIIVPLPPKECRLIEEIVNQKCTVHAPQRGAKRVVCELARKNALSALKQNREREVNEKILLDMQEQLGLHRFPKRIECFDNSHLSGADAVSSMVVFVDAKRYPSGYRKFGIKEAKRSDDYGMLREVLLRRYSQAQEEEMPDLLIVDGGKGHLHVAEEVLASLNIVSCDSIAIAKEEGRHDKGQTREKIFLSGRAKPVELVTAPLFLFLQRIRDEAHRFTTTFQRTRRSKSTIRSSLDSVSGIGPVKKKRLLQRFGSVRTIAQCSVEELMQVKGITRIDAEKILKNNLNGSTAPESHG